MVSALPCMMTLGTITLDYRGLYTTVSLSRVAAWIMRIPDDIRARSVISAGSVDRFIPVIVVGGFGTISTGFPVGIISILQTVYIADAGMLILAFRVQLSFRHPFLMFPERVVMPAPIAVLRMHLFGIA